MLALLQGALLLVCLLVVATPLPQPDGRYMVRQAMLTLPDGGQQLVNLPASFPEFAPPQVIGLAATFRLDELPHDDWSLYLPRFTNAAEVSVNGALILDTRRISHNNRIGRNSPDLAVIPGKLLRPGVNELAIKLEVWGPVSGYLDAIFVGPDTELRPAYNTRLALFDTLPLVFSSWQMVLAIVLGIMWLKRRQDAAYGVLALALAFGAVHPFLTPPDAGSWLPGLRAAMIGTAPLESGLLLIFMMLFIGIRLTPLKMALALAPGLSIILAGVFGGPEAVRLMFMGIGLPAIGVSLATMWWLSNRAACQRRTLLSIMLACAATILCASFLWDVLRVANVVAGERIFVSRSAYAVVLAVIGGCLTWRFASALNEVDSFAGRLVEQVREAEDKLRASFAREEQRKRAAALANERTRLTRDLHDGLGGQLVSIVALAERSDVNGAHIGEAARNALRDLRLVIDAMDDIDGDLMLALGAWRERTAARLSPHNIRLEWRPLSPEGLPLHEELRPWHVIQLLRLMDEAVTNTVKHAGARCITVSFGAVRPDGAGAEARPHGRIIIQDDGHGFGAASDPAQAAAGGNGRGMTNMMRRAERCGASLKVDGDDHGVRITIDLPEVFPESEA